MLHQQTNARPVLQERPVRPVLLDTNFQTAKPVVYLFAPFLNAKSAIMLSFVSFAKLIISLVLIGLYAQLTAVSKTVQHVQQQKLAVPVEALILFF